MEKFKLSLYAIVLIVAIACHRKSTTTTPPPPSVEVTTAQRELLYDQIEVASVIESLYEATIQPRIDGFLDSITYSPGVPLKRGDLLFVISPDTYNIALLTAQANLSTAEAQEILAHNNYQRALPLAQIDAISRSDLDQYTATHKAALSAVKSAREALKTAELNLSYTRITSPLDGIASESPAKEGDYVGLSTIFSTLTTISYIDSVEVEIAIPTAIYLSHLPTHKSNSYDNSKLLSDIKLSLSGGEQYPHLGEYDYTLQSTPSSSSSVAIMVKFPNPQGRLKSGMFARIRANIGSAKECVIVPQRAVSQNQGINSVWVMRPDSTVEFREVTLSKTTDQNWIITSGVAEGEDILLTGQLKVHNGAKVTPTKK